MDLTETPLTEMEGRVEMRVLVTGAGGFIGGYVVRELLDNDWEVVGLDNLSKYGRLSRSFEDDTRYTFVEGDCKDVALVRRALEGCEHMIMGAAKIGGISYFHEFAFDLLSENERIMAASFEAALDAADSDKLVKVTVLSSSMVFESAPSWPSKEGSERKIPPPHSSYGFQKLASEYFARAASEQYGLPFTILRPFNCVGIGEYKAQTTRKVLSGDIELAMSHVVPDLAQKLLKGQRPLHILGDGSQIRHYTSGRDLARGIVSSLQHPAALNEDFNLSTSVPTTVLELADLLWRRIVGEGSPLAVVTDRPYLYDVQVRSPDVSKARDLLGFEASTSLSEMLDEIIPWVEDSIAKGLI